MGDVTEGWAEEGEMGVGVGVAGQSQSQPCSEEGVRTEGEEVTGTAGQGRMVEIEEFQIELRDGGKGEREGRVGGEGGGKGERRCVHVFLPSAEVCG